MYNTLAGNNNTRILLDKEIRLLTFFRMPLCVREAVISVVKRPLRSLLVLQAIVWGTAAAIFPQAIYKGSMEMALTGTSDLASDRIVVTSPSEAVFDGWQDIAGFQEEIQDISFLTGLSRERTKGRTLIGTDTEHLSARRLVLASGRNFSEAEIRQGDPVCILEANIAERLFPDQDPIDKQVALKDDQPFRIIGVLKPLPPSILNTDAMGFEKDHSLHFMTRLILSELGVMPSQLIWLSSQENVLVPWKALDKKPQWLLMRGAPEKIPGILKQTELYFAASGREILTYSNTFLSIILAKELKDILQVSRDIFLFCITMGIIVIANVMLISINDRKLEIAVRRCEGARVTDIMAQFVLETALFCLMGALIGIPLGLGLAWVRAGLDPAALFSWAMPWGEALETTLYVFAGGLLAGVLPAWRASRLDPVEVLSRG